MEKKIDIATLYAPEIEDIENKLRNLRAGQFAGYNGHGSKAGFLENKIDALKKDIDNLILKIEYGKESKMDFILKP
ncbi:hypothetical protein GH808_04325 [Acetobacterium fimetarium]|uniref:Uncharacterized protein n=1 Tax=Acetobacterium fimetarium TaxID=52691 RepID=A0ABR6WSQ8_9FIRM|nr:hypothetical protein [Acetobacterium fimetarium]MBC3803659.1 hypothetical protein [Acetobacterium fimetarium]